MTYLYASTRLVFSGAVERFPKVKVAFFEGGCGWVPCLKTQLDMEIQHGSYNTYCKEFGVKLERKPSEYFDRFYVAATSYEPYLPDIARQWGNNHKIIIGSDFDHGDPIATWPHTITDVDAMDDLKLEDRNKILGENAAELFGL